MKKLYIAILALVCLIITPVVFAGEISSRTFSGVRQAPVQNAKKKTRPVNTANRVSNSKMTASEMYKKGLTFERAQNYTEAVKWYRKAAEAGNSSGMNNLGYAYAHGKGVELNYIEAVKWYRRAAEAGNSSGMNNLGYAYEHGGVFEQNYTEAIKWYRKAAEAGNSSAMYNLGYQYEHGHGVSQDRTKAIEWYKKAYNAGDADARERLIKLGAQ